MEWNILIAAPEFKKRDLYRSVITEESFYFLSYNWTKLKNSDF